MKKTRRSRASRASVTPLLLGAGAIAAGGAFALLTRAVANRRTLDVDRELHGDLTPAPSHPLRRAGKALGPIGKWYSYVPVALGLAGTVLNQREPAFRRSAARHNRRSGAAALAASGVASFALTELFDRVLPQPPTPPGHAEGKSVFPSGHMFGPLAVGLVSSYVLGRERLSSPGVTVPAALTIPLVSAATRIVEEKHWSSDVLGGALGGIAVAGFILAAYELARES
jgi:membrane-associated phospholipid phosphatase